MSRASASAVHRIRPRSRPETHIEPHAGHGRRSRREPYRITFGGRSQLHYAPDVARAFIAAARMPPDGSTVYNLAAPPVDMQELVAAIERAAPEVRGLIEAAEASLPYPERLPEPMLDLPLTPLADGVRETIEIFRAALD